MVRIIQRRLGYWMFHWSGVIPRKEPIANLMRKLMRSSRTSFWSHWITKSDSTQKSRALSQLYPNHVLVGSRSTPRSGKLYPIVCRAPSWNCRTISSIRTSSRSLRTHRYSDWKVCRSDRMRKTNWRSWIWRSRWTLTCASSRGRATTYWTFYRT